MPGKYIMSLWMQSKNFRPLSNRTFWLKRASFMYPFFQTAGFTNLSMFTFIIHSLHVTFFDFVNRRVLFTITICFI